MISNQLLQKTLDDIKAITGKDMAVFHTDGHLSAKTSRDFSVDVRLLLNFSESSGEYKEERDFQLFKIREDAQDEYLLVVQGASSSSELVGRMVKYQIERMLLEYKEL